MAAADVLGTIPCEDCAADGKSGTITVKEGKSGTANGFCSTCKMQRMWKSPAAVSGIRARLGKKGPAAPASGNPAKPGEKPAAAGTAKANPFPGFDL